MAKHVPGSERARRKSQRATLARSLKRKAARQQQLLPELSAELRSEKKKATAFQSRLEKERASHASTAKGLLEDARKQCRRADEATAKAKQLQQQLAQARAAQRKAEEKLQKQEAASQRLEWRLETAQRDSQKTREQLQKTRADLSERERHWAWVRSHPPKGWERRWWAKWLDAQGHKRPKPCRGYSCQ